MTLALWAIAAAIVLHALYGRKITMAVDTTAFNSSIDGLTAAMQDVATAIANIPAGDAAAQAAIDAATEKVNALIAQAGDMKIAEDSEDAA